MSQEAAQAPVVETPAPAVEAPSIDPSTMSDAQIIDMAAGLVSDTPDLSDAPAATAPQAEAEAPAVSETGEVTTEAAATSDEVLEKNWNAVVAKEQKLWEEQRALKEQSSQFSQLQGEVEKLRSELQARDRIDLEQFQSNPEAYLRRKFGIGFEQLADSYIKGEKPSVASKDEPKREDATARELAELKQMIISERQQAEYNKYQGRVESLLDSDAYRLLRARPGALRYAMTRAEHAAANGELLDPSDLLSRLQSEWREELSQLKSHEAVASVLGTSAPNPSNNSGQGEAPRSQGQAIPQVPKTLSNSMATTATKIEPQDWMNLSEEEQIKRVAELVAD